MAMQIEEEFLLGGAEMLEDGKASEHKPLAWRRVALVVAAGALIGVTVSLLLNPSAHEVSMNVSSTMEAKYSDPTKIYLNNRLVDKSKLPTMHTLGQMFNTHFSTIRDTHTTDVCRFAQSRNFPLKLKFKDRFNDLWEVHIYKESFDTTIFVPASSEIKWHGDEVDRTGLSSETDFARITFSYREASIWHSHGINLKVIGYQDKSNGAIGKSDWDKTMQVVGVVKDAYDQVGDAAKDAAGVIGATGR